MSINKKNHIHWFNNDLRVNDQPFMPLLTEKKHHFGVYVIDPRKFKQLPYGFRKTGLERAKFLRQCLVGLQESYSQLGSQLLVVYGKPEEIIPTIVTNYDASLSYQREYATEERQIQQSIEQQLDSSRLHTYDGNFLIHPSEIALDPFPISFSSFRKKAEKVLKNTATLSEAVPETLPSSPKQFDLLRNRPIVYHSKTVFPFPGGEKAALYRLNDYLFTSKAISTYKTTRNELLGENYSSKFSPWLASGALSSQTILQQIRQYEEIYGSNQSSYWLVFELLWRDYFRHAGRHYEDRLFHASGINNSALQSSQNMELLEKWKQAKTGNTFIDANMKELALTGFMSNRGRQNVASYLVHDLSLDWRLGAAWFEHNLLDYDVYSNQANWQYIAGLGFNPKGAAVFDIPFQTTRYDPTGTYQNNWINEEIR